ncbi:MAG: invasion associated locus B family protein [Magnetococcales bacterium]|nr:invasion associated locus B family protein [Magnetococcales bacterium]
MVTKKISTLLFLAVFALSGCQTLSEEFPWLGTEEETVEKPVLNEKSSPRSESGLALKKVDNQEVEEEPLQGEGDKPAAVNKISTEGGGPTQIKFDDWVVRCNEKGENCITVQQTRHEGGQLMLQLTVIPAKVSGGSEPVVTALLPLGFYLPDQARLFTGTSTSFHLLTVQQCIAQGCIALANEPLTLIEVLESATEEGATVVIRKRDSHELLNISFSPQGFKQAYAHLKTLN